MRTFAGLRGRYGPIPDGSFLRAADLARLTPADRDALAARGVVLDLDLRAADELATAPDALAGDDRFRYVRISLLGTEAGRVNCCRTTWATMYVASLWGQRAAVPPGVRDARAQPDGAVLFPLHGGQGTAPAWSPAAAGARRRCRARTSSTTRNLRGTTSRR